MDRDEKTWLLNTRLFSGMGHHHSKTEISHDISHITHISLSLSLPLSQTCPLNCHTYSYSQTRSSPLCYLFSKIHHYHVLLDRVIYYSFICILLLPILMFNHFLKLSKWFTKIFNPKIPLSFSLKFIWTFMYNISLYIPLMSRQNDLPCEAKSRTTNQHM